MSLKKSDLCNNDEPHHEHEAYGPEGEEDWCGGIYPVLAEFGQWNVVRSPDPDGGGYLVTVGVETPTYDIPSERVHESDWERHMSEKTWVNQGEFLKALSHARRQWPRR